MSRLTFASLAAAVTFLGCSSPSTTESDGVAKPTVRFFAGSQRGTEGVDTVYARLVLSDPVLHTVIVWFTKTGSADSTESNARSGTVVIPAGVTAVNMPIHLPDDKLVENTETVILRIDSVRNAEVGRPSVDTVKILDSDSLDRFRLADGQPPGWKESTDATTILPYSQFDSAGLYSLNDGGASYYVRNGLVKGISQALSGPGERRARALLMAFIPVAKAGEVFRHDSAEGAPVRPIDSISFMLPALTGGSVSAHFGQFYLKIGFTGFGADSAALNSAAGLFVKAYREKERQ